MKRQIGQNGRRSKGVRLAAAVFGAVALALAACSPGPDLSADEWVHKAQDQKTAGDLRGASVSLKNALQKAPNNPDTRFQLGLVYNAMGDGEAAEKEFDHARQLGADATALIVPYGRALYRQGRYKDVLEKTQAPADASALLLSDILVLRGDAFLGQDLARDAEGAYQAALGKNSDNAMAFAGLARVAMADKNMVLAQSFAQRALQTDKDNPDVIFLQGEVALNMKDFAAASRQFAAAVQKNRFEWRYLVYLGFAQLNEKKIDDAIVTLDKVLQLDPSQPEANFLRGLAAFQKKQYAPAKEYAERTLTRNEGHLPALLLAGKSSLMTNDLEQANKYFERYLVDMPNDQSVRKLLAVVQMQLKRPGDALKTLDTDAAGSDAEMLDMMGVAALSSGNAKLARDYLSKAASEQGQNASASLLTRLGFASIMAGDTAAGLDQLQAAAAKEPANMTVQGAYIWRAVNLKQYDRAVAAAKTAQAANPKSAAAFELEGIAQVGRNDLAAAEAALRKAYDMAPDNREFAANLANVVAKRDAAAARQILDAALKKAPTDTGLLMALASLVDANNKPAEALALVQKAAKTNPKAVEPRLILARLALKQNKYAEALQTVMDVYNDNQNNADLIYLKGLAEEGLGQQDNAIQSLQKVLELRPEEPDVLFHLALNYERQHNANSMGDYIKRALALKGADPRIRFANVRWMALNGQLVDAQIELDKLRKTYPDSIDLLRADARLDWLNGKKDQALAEYARLLQADPNAFDSIDYAGALMSMGQVDKGVAVMKGWLQKNPNDAYAQLFLADSLLQMGLYQRSLPEYQRMAQLQPNEPGVLNNLANVQMLAGDAAGALKTIDKALSRAPDNPDALDTKGSVLMKLGRPKDAVTYFAKAADLMPSSGSLQYHKAVALVAIHDFKQARSILTDLVNNQVKFGDSDKAATLLRQLPQK